MTFQHAQLKIPDCLLIEPRIFKDHRGLFAEIYKRADYEKMGIRKPILQTNYSESKKNVLRGLHYQIRPFAQAKLIRVIEGEVFDVAVDIRRRSSHYGQWVGQTLSAANKKILYIPEGFAHGFFVISKRAIVVYECTNIYSPQHERGIHWDDPSLKIRWPNKKPVLSKKDDSLPFLTDAEK